MTEHSTLAPHSPAATTNPRESGVALILALVLTIGLIGFTALSVEVTRAHSTIRASESAIFRTRMIAESGLAQALARLKEGGQTAPVSGNGTAPIWVEFGDGEYFFETVQDLAEQSITIRSWGRIPLTDQPSGTTVSPDDFDWDGSGYLTQGVEIAVVSSRYLPESPVYFGNGGLERPLGGFNWGNSVDVFDSSTWQKVTSASSKQSSSAPFKINALSHPYDYLYNGGAITPMTGTTHEYSPWTSQTPIGQVNIQAWMDNSAGGGSAWGTITPGTTAYSNDPSDEDYVLPVDAGAADVQDYAWNLWSTYQSAPNANTLNGGSKQGTYGDLANPSITFVTGQLRVRSGRTFKGAGILVIRDDFDPNYDVNNTPSTSASLRVDGTLEWTGLVIIAGWRPDIRVNNGGDLKIVGALMGEDSVMSGGEVSLDSATIILNAQGNSELMYSAEMFQEGSFIYDYLPLIERQVVGVREIYPD